MTPAAAAKSLQLCLTLCDPIDGSSPGFSVPGILQARILEWAAISFSLSDSIWSQILCCPSPSHHLFSWSSFPQPILTLRALLSHTEQIESQEGQGQIYTLSGRKKAWRILPFSQVEVMEIRMWHWTLLKPPDVLTSAVSRQGPGTGGQQHWALNYAQQGTLRT